MQEIVLRIEEPEADATRLDELSLSLRAEIESTGVGVARRVSTGDAPRDSRGLDATELAALIVAVPAALQSVAAVVTAVLGWLTRAPQDRAVKISIGDNSLELSATDPNERAQVVNAFLDAVEVELR